MKDFLFVYRADTTNAPQPSPEDMQASMKKWMDWMGGIAAQNKLVDRGNRLERAGMVVKPGNLVTDGPYTELKETVGGYSIIKAASLQEATEMAHGCPILNVGGSVEIREIGAM